jgi:hypothetical protein
MMLYLKQLLRRLTADKKKLSVMVGLLAVLMLLWGRLILKEVPRTATASPDVTQVSSLFKTAPRLEPSEAVHKVEMQAPAEVSRDLFAINTDAYATLKIKPVVEQVAAKSVDDSSDEHVKVAAVMQAVKGLRLQTTMQGPQPLALINGQLIQVGQSIRGFALVEVLPRQVILRMNGIDIHLEM